MILCGLDNIVQDPSDISSQIKFCELRAIVTAKNGDRDISKMYTAIAESIRILANFNPTTKPPGDDTYRNDTDDKNKMDTTTNQDGQHAPEDGIGSGQPKEKEYP